MAAKQTLWALAGRVVVGTLLFLIVAPLLAVLAFCARPIYHALTPLTYNVEVDAVFEVNGARVTTEPSVTACTVTDLSGTFTDNGWGDGAFNRREVGDPPYAVLPDGSALFLAGFQRCAWTTQPDAGKLYTLVPKRRGIQHLPDDEVAISGALVRVDAAKTPKTGELIPLLALADGPVHGVALLAITARIVDRPPLQGMTSDLPFLRRPGGKNTPEDQVLGLKARLLDNTYGRCDISKQQPEVSGDWATNTIKLGCPNQRRKASLELSVSDGLDRITIDPLVSMPEDWSLLVFGQGIIAKGLSQTPPPELTTVLHRYLVWAPKVCVADDCFVMRLDGGEYHYKSLVNPLDIAINVTGAPSWVHDLADRVPG